MIHGSGLCGAVRFQLEGTPQFINHCHCSMCRKAHGAAFGSLLHTHGRGFRWLLLAAMRKRGNLVPESRHKRRHYSLGEVESVSKRSRRSRRKSPRFASTRRSPGRMNATDAAALRGNCRELPSRPSLFLAPLSPPFAR